MTPEREKEIRMACAVAGPLLDCAIPQLLAEIDRLRDKIEVAESVLHRLENTKGP